MGEALLCPCLFFNQQIKTMEKERKTGIWALLEFFGKGAQRYFIAIIMISLSFCLSVILQ